MQNKLRIPVLFLSLLAGMSIGALGKGRGPGTQLTPAQDEIQVLGHLPLPGARITRFVATRHYQRDYLYAERQAGAMVTLVDVTDLEHPEILANMPYPAGTSDRMVAVAGNAALVSSENAASGVAAAPRVLRIMSFADPLHPRVQQEFTGVTAIEHDQKRQLIFIANADGLWILQQKFAVSPEQAELERSIERTVLETR